MKFLDCDDENHSERYGEIYAASWQLANKLLYKFLSSFQLTPFHFNSSNFFFFFLGEISIQAIIVKDLLVYVWIGIKFSYIWRFVLSFFFFFYLCVSVFRRQSALFMYCSRTHNHFI